jgi:RNA polymerase sigma-70 factor, ECF subfamily
MTEVAAPPQELERQLEQHRRELVAYSYRMLGSAFEAEDAVQETMVRAWRSHDRFEGRSSLRSWLYRIATNVCLDMLDGRNRRARPMEMGPEGSGEGPLGDVLPESVWLQPMPDGRVLAPETDPAELAVARESIRLAFLAALQHLPPRQRVVLILREVLRWKADEVAALLGSSVASVNSALQRARATIEKKLPEQSQQETLRALGDEKLREIVEQYADAWERNDVDTVVDMLADDAAFTMPPQSRWFQGKDGIRGFLEMWSMLPDWGWKSIPTTANGQPALAFYSWDEEKQARVPFAVNVLTFEGDKIKEIDAFILRGSQDPDPEVQARTPEQPADYEKLAKAYSRFGLPATLD